MNQTVTLAWLARRACLLAVKMKLASEIIATDEWTPPVTVRDRDGEEDYGAIRLDCSGLLRACESNPDVAVIVSQLQELLLQAANPCAVGL